MFKTVTEKAAEQVHEWLRDKEVLDDAHDVPWAVAPSAYRHELIAVLEPPKRRRQPDAFTCGECGTTWAIDEKPRHTTVCSASKV
jgi:rubrerythrin